MKRYPALLDKKQTFLGMELEELAVGGLIINVVGMFFGLFLPSIILALIAVVIIKKKKSNMPDGYIIHHIVYRKLGVKFKGLLPPHITRFDN